jgi:hypothetical protein
VCRDVEKILGHEQRDEGHHLQIRLQGAELLPHLGLAIRRGLKERQPRGLCGFLQRIRLLARLLGRDVHTDDVLAALEQRIQHRFAKRLLAVDDDAHHFSDADMAPEALISATCFAV